MPNKRERHRVKIQTAHQKSVTIAKEREEQLRANNEWAPFRLLDLTAEIRLRIYIDYVQDFSNTVLFTRLNYTVLPDLCDVSRQLRKEVRPLWFSETEFTIRVGANIDAQRRYMPDLGQIARFYNSYSSGVLVFSTRAGEVLKNAGNDALFRHVRFVIYNNTHMVNIWASESRSPFCVKHLPVPFHEREKVGALSMKSTIGVELKVTQQIGYERQGDSTASTTVDAARQRAISVSQRSDFRGFSLLDLQWIAAALRR